MTPTRTATIRATVRKLGGRISDAKLAQSLGISETVVRRHRHELGILPGDQRARTAALHRIASRGQPGHADPDETAEELDALVAEQYANAPAWFRAERAANGEPHEPRTPGIRRLRMDRRWNGAHGRL